MSLAVRSRTLYGLGLLLAGQTFVIAFGCAGKSERTTGDRAKGGDDSGGTAGTSSGGMAGTVPTGGVGPMTGGTATSGAAGTSAGGIAAGGTSGAATGGVAGDGGSAGGGGSGTGAMAGEAGQPSTVVECETAADCSMASDCCGCRSEPIRGPRLECPLDCLRDACGEMNIEPSEIECLNGRCVIARSCDTSGVTCPALPPMCAEGTVPSVVGDCFGPCLPPTECLRVESCADCGDALCFVFEALPSSHYCIERDDDCNSSENYCGCLGIDCNVCSATDPSVTCACVVC